MNTLTIPPELIALITVALGGFITWLVVEGVKGLSEAFGKDLSKVGKVLAAVISTGVVGIVVGVINALSALVPPEYVPTAQAALTFLVSLFAAFGYARRAKLAKLVK